MHDPAEFIHRSPAATVVAGAGAIARLGPLLDELELRRPMLLAGRRAAASPAFQSVRNALTGMACTEFTEVPQHSGVEAVRRIRDAARAHGADCFVAVGGGSVSDSAKAAALWLAEGGQLEDHATRFTPPSSLVAPTLAAPKLPIVSIPMTASAAEVTPGLGVRTADGRKLLFSDPKLASRLIVIDAQANLSVPASLMLSTGMNGLAHCVEGLYSKVRTPVTTALALQGIRLFLAALAAVAAAPQDIDARARLLAAAHLSGLVLLNARTCFHHAICHALGAVTGVSHGEANSVVLPHAMRFNAEAAADELAAAARAVGEQSAEALVASIERLRAAIGTPQRLRELGLAREALPAVAAKVMSERGLYFNPRTVRDADEVRSLLENTW